VAAGLPELRWAAWKHRRLVCILPAKQTKPGTPYCRNSAGLPRSWPSFAVVIMSLRTTSRLADLPNALQVSFWSSWTLRSLLVAL
jgi:hypothetical protein